MSLVERHSLFCVKCQRPDSHGNCTEVSWYREMPKPNCINSPEFQQNLSGRGKSLAVPPVSVGQGSGRVQRGRLHTCITKTPANQHNLAPTPPSCGFTGGTGCPQDGADQFAGTKPHGCCSPSWAGRKSKVQYRLQQITYSFFQPIRQ